MAFLQVPLNHMTLQEATQSEARPMHIAYTQRFLSERGWNERKSFVKERGLKMCIVDASLHFPEVPSFL